MLKSWRQHFRFHIKNHKTLNGKNLHPQLPDAAVAAHRAVAARDAYVHILREALRAELERLGPCYTTRRSLTDLGPVFDQWIAEGRTALDLHRKLRRRRGPKRVARGYKAFAQAVRAVRGQRGHFAMQALATVPAVASPTRAHD